MRIKDRKGVVLLTIFIILAVISFIYAGVVKAVGSGTAFFMVWIVLGCLMSMLGVCAYAHVWEMLPRLLRIAIVTGVVLIGVYFLVIEGCIISRFASQGEKDLDYIIVLGAQVRKSGPSLVLKYRLDKAKEYMDENPMTVCIVSGGQGYNEPCSEAEAMAQYLEEHGISQDRIILEDQSTNTVQNIKFSRKCTDLTGKSVGIITNNFHLYRGVEIAKKQGIPQAVGIAAKSTKLYLPNNLIRECFGVTKDIVMR